MIVEFAQTMAPKALELGQQLSQQTLLRVLNKLLAGRSELLEHAGRSFCFEFERLSFACRVLPNGLLELCDARGQALDLTIKVTPTQLMQAIRQGQSLQKIRATIHGDMALASTLSELLKTLRWNYEADLVRYFGAERGAKLAALLQDLEQEIRHIASTTRNELKLWLQANPPAGLVSKNEFASFAREVAELDSALSGLQRRLAQ